MVNILPNAGGAKSHITCPYTSGVILADCNDFSCNQHPMAMRHLLALAGQINWPYGRSNRRLNSSGILSVSLLSPDMLQVVSSEFGAQAFPRCCHDFPNIFLPDTLLYPSPRSAQRLSQPEPRSGRSVVKKADDRLPILGL